MSSLTYLKPGPMTSKSLTFRNAPNSRLGLAVTLRIEIRPAEITLGKKIDSIDGRLKAARLPIDNKSGISMDVRAGMVEDIEDRCS